MKTISFDGYRNDMNELAESGSAVISAQSARIKELERLVGILIQAAGKIEVSDYLLGSIQNFEIAVEYCPSRASRIYSVILPKQHHKLPNL